MLYQIVEITILYLNCELYIASDRLILEVLKNFEFGSTFFSFNWEVRETIANVTYS